MAGPPAMLRIATLWLIFGALACFLSGCSSPVSGWNARSLVVFTKQINKSSSAVHVAGGLEEDEEGSSGYALPDAKTTSLIRVITGRGSSATLEWKEKAYANQASLALAASTSYAGQEGEEHLLNPNKSVKAGVKIAPFYNATEYVEQLGGQFYPGDSIYLYSIGASSTVWMTWIEQLHFYLLRLGYQVPPVDATYKPRFTPKSVPSCDDSAYFEPLLTARFGRIGWSSWDFAYEGWEGCKDGFRNHSGVLIKCQHGPGCHFSKNATSVAKLAEDAAKSNITMLSTWFNDDQQRWSKFKCFNGTELNALETAPLSIDSLRRTVRAIHKKNPNTWVLIIGKYPQCWKHVTEVWFTKLNRIVKEALEHEPRTLFVDYYMPPDNVAQMYQVAHTGHPNCRGSKLMAHAVMRRLWEAKVLGRNMRLVHQTITSSQCSSLVGPDCHSSALCWLDPADHTCKPYSAGSKRWHFVKSVEIAE